MPEKRPVRGCRRFKISLPLWVRFRDGIKKRVGAKGEPNESGSEQEEQTITTDIGSGGCFFYTRRKPRVGASATILVDVPIRASRMASGKVLCHGKVVRVSEEQVQGKVGVACKIDSYTFRLPGRN